MPRSLILAGEQHDVAWLDWETAPSFDPATGRPHPFGAMGAASHAPMWAAGVDRAFHAWGMYPALMISRPGGVIYWRFTDRHRLDAADAVAAERFLREQAPKEAAWAEALRLDQAALAHDSELIAFADTLSLAFCGELATLIVIEVPGHGPITVSAQDEASSSFTRAPWPFRTKPSVSTPRPAPYLPLGASPSREAMRLWLADTDSRVTFAVTARDLQLAETWGAMNVWGSWRGGVLAMAGALLCAGAAPAPKAAILLPGSIGDHSWNALGFAILQSLRSDGFATSYSENVSDADEENALRDDAGGGDAIVIGHSGRFMSAMEDVASDFPRTQFIVTSGDRGIAPNVMSIDWNNAQFGCELGMLAARMSRTHKVAGIYGLQGVPNITAQAGGFRICAEKAGARVTIVYVKDMEDAAASKETALALISDGDDVLSGKLNAAQAGIVEAAREKSVFVTGRSLDDAANAPQAVLTDVIEDWPSMFRPVAERVGRGKLAGTFTEYGYDTAPVTGATLEYDARSEFNPVVPAAVRSELRDLEARFRSGGLVVRPTREDARAGS